ALIVHPPTVMVCVGRSVMTWVPPSQVTGVTSAGILKQLLIVNVHAIVEVLKAVIGDAVKVRLQKMVYGRCDQLHIRRQFLLQGIVALFPMQPIAGKTLDIIPQQFYIVKEKLFREKEFTWRFRVDV